MPATATRTKARATKKKTTKKAAKPVELSVSKSEPAAKKTATKKKASRAKKSRSSSKSRAAHADMDRVLADMEVASMKIPARDSQTVLRAQRMTSVILIAACMVTLIAMGLWYMQLRELVTSNVGNEPLVTQSVSR